MGLIFKYTASAICYSIIHQHSQLSNSTLTFPHNEVVRFVVQQYTRLPDFLKLPMVIITLIFDLWGIFQGGNLFHRLPPNARCQQIELWRNSPLGVCRDLIRFYDSLTIFGLYSIKRNDIAKSHLPDFSREVENGSTNWI